ncbi:hypothetical protein GGD81_001092 [Rhodobium orientis]|uniref:DUF3302 domain-containing protein n=1 Tax=Rhodobium orientis TaxID=34017 RepID=A0A327JKU5_9HYPH|nr:DUF3302 domain-containing protein [Rhodobium orientis]MBB4302068.1 hypothetical protein [Rhodobium orientis]MBK5951341.1 hypothetical protein [Rhodobium orientis]RAI25954.1 hypothetical protein CH339_16070 [Rhodobium orientis]
MVLKFFALVVLIILLVTGLAVIWLVGALPGRIARARGHGRAEAVAVAGWCSLLMPVPLWPLAMVWAHLDGEKPVETAGAG